MRVFIKKLLLFCTFLLLPLSAAQGQALALQTHGALPLAGLVDATPTFEMRHSRSRSGISASRSYSRRHRYRRHFDAFWLLVIGPVALFYQLSEWTKKSNRYHYTNLKQIDFTLKGLLTSDSRRYADMPQEGVYLLSFVEVNSACERHNDYLFELKEALPHLGMIAVLQQNKATFSITKTQNFFAKFNPYQSIWLDETGDFLNAFCPEQIPETLLIDGKSGEILHHHSGVINAQIWREHFAAHLPLAKHI